MQTEQTPPQLGPNDTMKYLSLCSGIEAASVAWHHLGWQPFAFSEIEPFPSAVLAHHWPNVPNLGDMTQFQNWTHLEDVDLLVGGTPCQAFSVAGLRKSLDDARGNLTLTYITILNTIDNERRKHNRQPAICVWENVPGVLNTKDNAFGCFLAGLAGENTPLEPPRGKWTNAGVVYGPERAIAWRVIDAQYLGVAQRRRRVFVVASAREGFCPEQVLFEFDGVRRDSPPSRETREAATGDTGTGFTASSFGAYGEGVGTLRSAGGDLGGGSETLVTSQYGNIAGSLTARHDSSPCADRGQNVVGLRMVAFGEYVEDETASTMKQRDYKDATDLVAFSSNAQADDARDTPISDTLTKSQTAAVAYGLPGNWIGRSPENGGNATEPMHNISPCLTGADKHAVAYSFDSLASNSMKSANPHSGCREVDLSKPLDTGRGLDPSCNQRGIGVVQSIGFNGDQSEKTRSMGEREEPAPTLRADGPAHVAYGIDEEQNAAEELMGCLKARTAGGGFEGAVAFAQTTRDEVREMSVVGALAAQPGMKQTSYLRLGLQVRRLTPVECHRLQGFPDNHCQIPWRGKPAEECPDGPQYKALGNSMAVPVMRWIGQRIHQHLNPPSLLTQLKQALTNNLSTRLK